MNLPEYKFHVEMSLRICMLIFLFLLAHSSAPLKHVLSL